MKVLELFVAMAKHGASDLHLKAGEPPVFRIGGDLVRAKSPPLSGDELRSLLTPLLDERSRQELDTRGYADFARQVDDAGRFRINIFRQLGNWSAAVRRVKPKVLTYAELGLPPIIARCAQYEHGLVLLGGITGSGKSTTLASILDDINHTRRCHILTIEDPVEYVFQDDKAVVNQREVFTDVATFADALRSAVREDPDVMLLGEMRDAETMETALAAAETGHLVFGTIHSSGAPQTLGRILDLFPKDKQTQIRTSMAFNMRCIINQQLLPQTNAPNGSVVPALEIMFITPFLKKLILDNELSRIADALHQDIESGNECYNRALHRLWKEQKISMETALAASPNPDELRILLRGITIQSGGIA